jgi:DNA gyrase subunit A
MEMKRDAFPKKILNQLYKLTPLQTSFSYNMIALTDRGSNHDSSISKRYFRHSSITEEKWLLDELGMNSLMAEARAHILEGLKIALDNIDAVIKTIKESKTREDAHSALMERFSLSEKQSQAILEMQLQRLAGLERKKIEDELTEKLILIADLRDILEKPARVAILLVMNSQR